MDKEQVLQNIQKHGPVGAADLADRLGLEEKQVRNAIDALRRDGEPIWHDPDRSAFFWQDDRVPDGPPRLKWRRAFEPSPSSDDKGYSAWSLPRLFGHSRHAPFYLAASCGVLAVPLFLWLAPRYAIPGPANVFFILYLGLTLPRFPRLTWRYLQKHAAGTDEPASVVFAVTFGAVVVAVASLFMVMNSGGAPKIFHLAVSLAAVGFGWLTIHTMVALHYAHRYWQPDENTEEEGTGQARAHVGGMEFPATPKPNGIDFLYFSFVTGMTAQTSDVDITSTAMRRLNLLHSIVSYFFNTVLVAAAVNVAVSLGQ